MKPVTLDAIDCYLLAGDNVWGKSISGEFEARSASDAGLSNREGRRAQTAETLLSLGFQFFLEGAAAAEFRAALRAYNNEPILAPFWPADCLLSELAACRWLGGLRLFYEPDWSQWQVRAAATAPDSFTPTAACRVVPVAWCRFDNLPAPGAADGDEAMEVDIAVVENGPADYAIHPTGVALGNGPTIGALTPKLLALAPDWSGNASGGAIELRIERERIGYGRGETENYMDQAARTRQKFILPPLGDEIAGLASLFREAGAVDAFWVPGVFAEARLAAGITAGAVIEVDDPTNLADLDYIALVSSDAIAARKINSRDGAALTLESVPGAFAAGTAVRALLLARFAGTKLKITWATPLIASASVEVIQLPTETTVPAGETVGETLGALPAKWWGYVVTDGVTTWQYTSHDTEIYAGSALGTFEPRPIDHGDITMEINLARHDVDLTIGWWSGNPFWRAKLDGLTFAPGKANLPAPPLTVQIYEGTIADPSAAQLIFTGRAKKPKFNGKKCTCTIAGLTALLDVKGPIQTVGPRCWVPLYSPLCGLDRDDSALDVDFCGKDENGALLFGLPGDAAFPALGADHFRFGYAERTLSDGTKRRYTIVRSDAPADAARGPLIGFPGNVDATRKYRKRTTSGTTHTGIWSLAACPYDHGHGGMVDLACSGHDDTYGDYVVTGTMIITPADDFQTAYMTISGLTLNGGGAVWAAVWGKTGLYGNGTHGPFDWGTFDPANVALKLFSSDPYQGFVVTVFEDFPWGAKFPLLSERDVFDKVETYDEDNEIGIVDNSVHAQEACGDWPLAGGGDESTPAVLPSGAAADAVVIAQTTRTLAGKNECIQTGSGPMRYTKIDGEVIEELSEENTTLRTSLNTLTVAVLGTPPDSPEAGWRLVPGCDKSYARCKALGNGDNFRGFPHFPKTNPALMPITQDTPSTGKK
jgi:hypothetical protein